MVKRFYFLFAVVIVLMACNNNSANEQGAEDSVSTDSLVDPSYNPKVEADSASKDMNLDSTQVKDSGKTGSDAKKN